MENKRLVVLDGNTLLIIATILMVSFMFIALWIGITIGRINEKVSSLEDIVFVNGVYKKLNSEEK